MKRILVVDDEAPIRAMLAQMLETEGYEVHTAEHGEEGLDLVRKIVFDLVITDMIMPVKDGLKFIMELIRDYPDMKILAISGGGALSGPPAPHVPGGDPWSSSPKRRSLRPSA